MVPHTFAAQRQNLRYCSVCDRNKRRWAEDRAPEKETNVGETRRQMEIIKFLMFIADLAEEHSVFPFFFDLFYSNCINFSDCSFVFFFQLIYLLPNSFIFFSSSLFSFYIYHRLFLRLVSILILKLILNLLTAVFFSLHRSFLLGNTSCLPVSSCSLLLPWQLLNVKTSGLILLMLVFLCIVVPFYRFRSYFHLR